MNSFQKKQEDSMNHIVIGGLDIVRISQAFVGEGNPAGLSESY